ncbi:hypothetical protein JCM5296_005150 [Sporobolomyces johnsonii]
MDQVHRALDYALSLRDRAIDRYHALNYTGKAILWIWVALHFVFAAVFYFVGWENIFAWLAGLADNIRELPYGWAILSAIIIVTSLPPLIGYGTAQTLVGFAYGVHPGWLISSFSCLAGGVFAFVLVRRLVGVFAPYIHKDKTFQALSQAVRIKGLPLIILLRLCPFPYPYSNAFFASVETVTLSQFFLATLTITPKLLLHVFVGHRTYLFASPEHRSKMDPLSKWLNGVFMVVGTLLGAATSWYLYKLTMRYVEEASGASERDLEAGLLDDVDELLLSSRERGESETEGEGEELVPLRRAREEEEEEEEEPVRRTATLVDTGSDLEGPEGERRDGGGGRATDEVWEETFSDFEDEAELRLAEEEDDDDAKDGRRDSMAWGLDDTELESFGGEKGQGTSSIDKRLD